MIDGRGREHNFHAHDEMDLIKYVIDSDLVAKSTFAKFSKCCIGRVIWPDSGPGFLDMRTHFSSGCRVGCANFQDSVLGKFTCPKVDFVILNVQALQVPVTPRFTK